MFTPPRRPGLLSALGSAMVCLPLSVACGDKDPGSDNPETIYLQDFTGVTDTYCRPPP